VLPWGPYLDGYQDTADQLRQHIWERSAKQTAAVRNSRCPLDRVTFERQLTEQKEAFLFALGGLPTEKTPLNVQTTGVLHRAEYDVEKLIYESLPGFHVTANLYLPARYQACAPAVLFVCGHAEEAKASASYQQVCQDLVRAGFIVLIIDPLGQGERMYYYNPETGKQDVPWGTTEHAHVGFQCHLIGTNVARYFLWDVIRAVDLLVSRPEVDASRIGVTGNSGGGTQTSLLLMAEPRIAAAVSCTYPNDRLLFMQSGQPHDAEQNYFGALTHGLNYRDMLATLAPRPLQLGAVVSDFFPIEGTLAAYEWLQKVYELYGAQDKLRLVIDAGLHAYSPVLRREAVAFFRHHLLDENIDLGPSVAVAAGPDESPLAANVPAATETAPPNVEPPHVLRCTKSGQVVAEFGSKTRSVFQLNIEAWEALQRERNSPCAEEIHTALKRIIRAERPRPPLWVRRLRAGTLDGVNWQHAYFFSEPSVAVATIEITAQGADVNDPLTVVLCEEGTQVVDKDKPFINALLQQHQRLLVVDPRGTGALAPRPVNARDPHSIFGTEHKLNYDAMMLRDSLFAMRVYDVERAIEYARRIAPCIRGVGRGVPGLYLLAAAALRCEPLELTLQALPPTWNNLVRERLVHPDPRLEVFGVLREFDVPDLLEALEAVGGKASIVT
jgi:hypothetical protein